MGLNGLEWISIMSFIDLKWTLATQQFGDLYHKTWDWWIFARSNHHHEDLHSSNKEIQQGNARRLTTLRNHGSVEVHGVWWHLFRLGPLLGGFWYHGNWSVWEHVESESNTWHHVNHTEHAIIYVFLDVFPKHQHFFRKMNDASPRCISLNLEGWQDIQE